GEVATVYRKMFLPNYGVFDEQRYFQAGDGPQLIELNGVAIGLTICEDIWEPGPPATAEALAGAQLIVNVSASPYHAGKPLERELSGEALAPVRRLVAATTDDDVGGALAEPLGPEQEVYQALVTGVRDYVDKNGFKRVVLGLSGGIDSSLVALVAVDALGPDRVATAVMPSPYSSDDTQADARTLASNLGAELIELPRSE